MKQGGGEDMEEKERGECQAAPLVKVCVQAGTVFLGPGLCELMEKIHSLGSIQEACASMDMSYSKGSKMIKKLEGRLGISIVKRQAGGSGGGSSSLTEEGRWLVRQYRSMTAEIEAAAQDIFGKYFQNGLIKPDGGTQG